MPQCLLVVNSPSLTRKQTVMRARPSGARSPAAVAPATQPVNGHRRSVSEAAGSSALSLSSWRMVALLRRALHGALDPKHSLGERWEKVAPFTEDACTPAACLLCCWPAAFACHFQSLVCLVSEEPELQVLSEQHFLDLNTL